ncbi:MAG: hypothetical protein HQ552_10955 [Desulfobacteraceae bacterium]|nr:hypothetical protein [Desulfobacteraceae bacterium]
MQILTTEEIKQDIEGFQARIDAARKKLAMLPGGRLAYPEHKKREMHRRQLESEIEHVHKLIGYATEALQP